MLAIRHDHALDVFQQLSAIDDMHSSRVCCTIRIERAGKEHRHYTAGIVVLVVPERVRQRAVTYFVVVA